MSNLKYLGLICLALVFGAVVAGCNSDDKPTTNPLLRTIDISKNTVLDKNYENTSFNIIASDITFDLNNFSISVPDNTYGISVKANNVTIKNGKMSGGTQSTAININSCVTKEDLILFNVYPDIAKSTVRDKCITKTIISNMTFDNLETHVYSSAFVTGTVLTDNIHKNSSSVSIYLDAEGGNHIVSNSIFYDCGHRNTGRRRECIAVDGTDRTLIENNVFNESTRKKAFQFALTNWNVSAIGDYRNCGERIKEWDMDFLRYTCPSYNRYINNTFNGGSAGIIHAMRKPHNFDNTTCPPQIDDCSFDNQVYGNTFNDVSNPVIDYGTSNYWDNLTINP